MNTTRTVLGLLTASLLTTSACVAGAGFRAGAGAGGTATAGGGGEGGGEEGGYGGPAGSMGGGNGGPAAASGPVEPRWDDFAFAVRERSGSYWAPWTITKLTTFKVAPACYAKMADKDSGALNNTSYYVRSVHELAKKWTGEDWEDIENQRSDRAKDRALVEPMMNEFGQRFHMTIAVEGDDCEVNRDAFWIRYWYSISEAFADYPPVSGKVFITMNAAASARDISVDVDETGTQFTFTVPRDFEAKDWSDKLEKPFRKNAGKL